VVDLSSGSSSDVTVHFVLEAEVSFLVRLSASYSNSRTASAIAWAGLSVFDTVIFSLTLYKAFTIGRGIRLLDVIVRDGMSS
jgi:hypothetical protein